MTDLITHLRDQATESDKIAVLFGPSPLGKLLTDAADEIERLRNSNLALRSAVEALSKELTTEAQSMMRQPEAGVIQSIAERLHAAVFRRKWRDRPTVEESKAVTNHLLALATSASQPQSREQLLILARHARAHLAHINKLLDETFEEAAPQPQADAHWDACARELDAIGDRGTEPPQPQAGAGEADFALAHKAATLAAEACKSATGSHGSIERYVNITQIAHDALAAVKR